MLPTQGQGASQAIEDAEALGAFFEGISETPSADALSKILEVILSSSCLDLALETMLILGI